MTPDDLSIGVVIWSTARRGSDDTAAHGGMVCSDVQVNEGTGEQFVLIADTEHSKWWVGKQGQKSMIKQRVVTIRPLYFGDIDWDMEAPILEAAKLAGMARKCWIAAGIRSGYRGPVDHDLMGAAERLWLKAEAMQNPKVLNG